MTHVFLDAMGGDHAPGATVLGALEALGKDDDLRVTLAGDQEAVRKALEGAQPPAGKTLAQLMARVDLLHTPDVITNHDAPVLAVRQKKGSAIVLGMQALKEKTADAFVSAGSTGAVLAGGMFRLGRIEGIERPALAPLLPNGKGHFLLVDCGANVDCKPEYLVQFGIMGDTYMRCVRGLDAPRVGLVNIGEEAEKGNALAKETYPLMQKAPFRFVGNVEARYITADRADVIVCDGFSGNLILKFMEGVAGTLLGMIKRELLADARGKLGALIAKPAFGRVKKAMDYTEVGGAPLLGVQGAVVKAHGSSDAHAIASAIRQAVLMARGGVAEKIAAQLQRNTSQA